MELGLSLGLGRREEEEEEEEMEEDDRSSSDLQLTLLPFASASSSSSKLGFPWPTQNKISSRGVDVNRLRSSLSEAEENNAGSPNSTVSSFNAGGGGGGDGDGERALSRASDEDENGSSRKKLRLSKEQSAFLEDSFKEHSTLNPKEKVALARQLNLRPRQVEVWFQNRRARTKLKQTEVDCEYLKRCCETLTEENRRLQKELSELRALKTRTHPFLMQLPATTLSMCPSCERTTTTTTTAAAPSATAASNLNKANAAASFGSLFGGSKPRFHPFAPRPATSPAS